MRYLFIAVMVFACLCGCLSATFLGPCDWIIIDSCTVCGVEGCETGSLGIALPCNLFDICDVVCSTQLYGVKKVGTCYRGISLF